MELLWGPHREKLRQEAWMVLIEGAAARRWGRVSRVAHGKGGLASWEDRLVNWVGRVAGPMWLCSMPRTRRLLMEERKVQAKDSDTFQTYCACKFQVNVSCHDTEMLLLSQSS